MLTARPNFRVREKALRTASCHHTNTGVDIVLTLCFVNISTKNIFKIKKLQNIYKDHKLSAQLFVAT